MDDYIVASELSVSDAKDRLDNHRSYGGNEGGHNLSG